MKNALALVLAAAMALSFRGRRRLRNDHLSNQRQHLHRCSLHHRKRFRR